ncbi:MAG: right-handed parallel beta-helix repeat-containing protein [Bacteroidales bacterium]
MRRSITVLFLSVSIAVNATTYYVATTGNDNNPGTITKPWSTWQKGFNSISAGDILYIRGGTYTATGIVIADVFAAVGVDGKNGTSGSQYQVYAYPGEIPVLDCSTLTNNSYVRIGIMLTNSSYWHLMGLEIKNCNQVTASSPHYGGQGIYITGSSNIIIENCAAHNNQGPGMGTRDVNELTFLNCDSHDNYDPYSDTPGDNADGFDIGFNKNNGIVRCTGCRWNNSDDGFDMYQDSGYSGIYYLTNCWSWHQGYRSDGVTTGGDGNGFKYGADLQSYDGVTKRYSYNCIAYANRCRGFSQESA